MRLPAAALAFAAVPLCGASGATLMVGPDVCAVVADAAALPGVAYTPGIDASGRPVAPADLPGSSLKIEAFPVEITRSLAGKFGIPVDRDPFGAELRLGYVVVDEQGRAAFNGQPLLPDARAIIAQACRNR